MCRPSSVSGISVMPSFLLDFRPEPVREKPRFPYPKRRCALIWSTDILIPPFQSRHNAHLHLRMHILHLVRGAQREKEGAQMPDMRSGHGSHRGYRINIFNLYCRRLGSRLVCCWSFHELTYHLSYHGSMSDVLRALPLRYGLYRRRTDER